MQTGAALALLAVLNPSAVLAETAQSEPEAAASQESVQAETKPEKSGVDMESWYRVRGEGFALSVPPNYEDIVEYDVSAPDHLFGVVALVSNVSNASTAISLLGSKARLSRLGGLCD